MRAIVHTEYGSPDVLALRDLEVPAVGDDQVLVRVRAASVNPLDWHVLRGTPYFLRLSSGLRRPKSPIRGVDLAGEVEAVGRSVTAFRPGDEVFGAGKGAFAEYACVSAKVLAPKPLNVSFEQAAALPVAGLTALQGLRDKGRLQASQRVLVIGASGGVGTFAVQLARSFGAEVTGVCSAGNAEMVRAIGAARVFDYTREDFARSGERFDLILDAAGSRTLSDCRRALAPEGSYVVVAGPFLQALLLSPFVRQRLVPLIASLNGKDLLALKELVEAGKVTPVVDRSYPLSEVPDAIRYLEQGHARGKVVITM